MLMSYSNALFTALMDAFDREGLERLLRFGLERDLEGITTANSMGGLVADVVETARRESWLDELTAKAIEANPNNPNLKRLTALNIDSTDVGDMDQNVVRELELVVFGSERGHIDGVLAQLERMTVSLGGIVNRIELLEQHQRQPRQMRLMWSMLATSVLSAVFAGVMALGGI